MKKLFDMKKLFAIVLAALVLLMLGACRAESSAGEATSATETSTDSGSTDTSSSTTDSSSTTTAPVDVNADEEAFVQTGEADEDVTLRQNGADPSTIVVDFGDLVTLNVYSERLKPTQVYSEDLIVDQTVERGKTITVTIEANEEGVFYVTDKLTGDQLFRFMVAGMSIGQEN